jgi:hypothetical protein
VSLNLIAQHPYRRTEDQFLEEVDLSFTVSENLHYVIIITFPYLDWLQSGRQRGRGSSPGRGEIFLLSTSSRPVLGPTHPPIQWVPGALYPEVKRPGCKANHSPPTSAEVKNTWIYTSAPPIRLHDVVLNWLSTGTTLQLYSVRTGRGAHPDSCTEDAVGSSQE